MRDPENDGESERELLGFGSNDSLEREEVPDSDTVIDYEPLRDRRTPRTGRTGKAGGPHADAGDAWRPGQRSTDSEPTWNEELEADRLFDVLANEQRRVTLHYLRDEGGTAPFDELVDAVASRTSDDRADHHDRRTVQSALYHVHLPKLEDVGLLADSDPDGEVRLSPRVAGVPWSLFDAQ